MAETLQSLSVISLAAAAVCFVLSVFLWFLFKIPHVIGDLSGRTARKSIARIRMANEQSGSKSYKAGRQNVLRGKLTDTMVGGKKKKKGPLYDKDTETGLLGENQTEETGAATTVGLQSETTGLLVETEATVKLDTKAPKPKRGTGGKKLKLLEEVILIHTDEERTTAYKYRTDKENGR